MSVLRGSRFALALTGSFALGAAACAGSNEKTGDQAPPVATPSTDGTLPTSSAPMDVGTTLSPGTEPPAPLTGTPVSPMATSNAPAQPLGSAPTEPGVAPAVEPNPAVVPSPDGDPVTPDPAAPGAVTPDPVPVEPSPPVQVPDPLAGDVAFSVPSQSFIDSLEVTLSTAVADAEIRYTVDGTVPDASALLFDSTPLTLTETTQVRAQAFIGGAASGALSTGLYIARTFEATSNLPLVIIDGYGGGKPTDKEVYLDAAVMVFEPVDGMASLANLPTVATRAGYHVRGQSSASFPQAPYKIEFWDNQNADIDLPVMGLEADSDWAIIPPYYDRTLIRNPFVYDLGKEMGLQTVDYAFAEIYIHYDGGPLEDSHYEGVYWFTETIKNNKARIDLKQLDATDTELPDISGGYIMKFDQAAAEEPLIQCSGAELIPGFSFGGPPRGNDEEDAGAAGTCWRDLELVDPETPNQQQLDYLTSYIQTFHDGLQQEPIFDYSAVIDVRSFVDYLIVSELTLNVDAYVRSCYYHKDRDGLLAAGPLWDYNFALGGVGAMKAVPDPNDDNPVTFRYAGTRNVNGWYPRLVTDPNFMAAVRTRYDELRQGLLSNEAVSQRIDGLIAPLTDAAARDSARWPVSEVIQSETGFTGGPTAPTWAEQVQVMRDFVDARLLWLDDNLP